MLVSFHSLKFIVKTRLYIILLFACLGLVNKIHAQQVLRGRTLSSDSANVVQLVSITNKTTGERVISNRAGYFRITVHVQDTIHFSAIGYEGKTIWASNLISENEDDTAVVLLVPTAYQLQGVRIVASNPKRDSIARAAAEYLRTNPLMNNYDRILDRPKGGLMSPLTAMYEQFSKAGRDNAKFEEFLSYMERQKMVDRRYNRDFIKRATGLQEKYIDDFFGYCKLDKQFIITASDYDLIVATRNCAAEFKARRGIPN